MNYRDSEWYQAIRDHPVGTRLRMVHEGCSTGEALLVSKTDKGCSAYCFRCKASEFVGAPPESLAQKLDRQQAEKLAGAQIRASKAPPEPRETDPTMWPLEAKIWLYRAGLNNHDIMESGIYYHRASRRVVLLVFDGDTLVYWQARGFDPEAPKYLNPSVVDRTALVANWYGSERCLVLTEDWLSGYRVHRATGFQVYALLGTYLTDKVAAQVVYNRVPVAVWLDGDKPGQDAARKIVAKLTALNHPVKNIVTVRDPKLYSDTEIREVLSESGFGISP